MEHGRGQKRKLLAFSESYWSTINGPSLYSLVVGHVASFRSCEQIRIEVGSPLLASQQGGVAASIKKISRSDGNRRSRGGFPLDYQSENHPGSAISGCFATFLDRSATPPCGGARRGLLRLDFNSFTPSLDRRYSPACFESLIEQFRQRIDRNALAPSNDDLFIFGV
jgi:hypothetical protein